MQRIELSGAVGKLAVVGYTVAVEVAVRQTVAVEVLGEDQPFAGLLEVVVATVAVDVFPVQGAVRHEDWTGQVASVEGRLVVARVAFVGRQIVVAGRDPVREHVADVGVVRVGAVGVAGQAADGDRLGVVVTAHAIGPLVDGRGERPGRVVEPREHRLATHGDVVVDLVLEVGHALFLVATLTDVGDVRDGVAAIAAEGLVGLRAPCAVLLAAPRTRPEAVEEVAVLGRIVLAQDPRRVGLGAGPAAVTRIERIEVGRLVE